MAKVEIKEIENDGFSIKVDGHEINQICTGLDVHIGRDSVPTVNIDIPWGSGEFVCDHADVLWSMNLYVAAEIVRKELMKRKDWYNALIASIYGYLNEYYDEEMDHWLAANMAVGLANRIIGMEEKT
jgi:hypothetical protein